MLKNDIYKIKKNNIQLPTKLKYVIEQTFDNFNSDDFVIDNDEKTKKLEQLRPYIGEELWKLRQLYYQVIGRVIILYSDTYKKDQTLTHWTEDNLIQIH